MYSSNFNKSLLPSSTMDNQKSSVNSNKTGGVEAGNLKSQLGAFQGWEFRTRLLLLPSLWVLAGNTRLNLCWLPWRWGGVSRINRQNRKKDQGLEWRKGSCFSQSPFPPPESGLSWRSGLGPVPGQCRVFYQDLWGSFSIQDLFFGWLDQVVNNTRTKNNNEGDLILQNCS